MMPQPRLIDCSIRVQRMKCVLLVPDIFDRADLRLMLDVILCDLQMASVVLQQVQQGCGPRLGPRDSASRCPDRAARQESVAAVYGAGIPSACVVDVGDQKTNIACVDDGISLPASRITLRLGGLDVTRTLYYCLQQVAFPYRECNLRCGCVRGRIGCTPIE